MAEEMIKKHYPLPEKVSERTVRLAHQRVKVLEEYAMMSDEALVMLDEMLKKQYPLPEKISEETIRLAHQRV